MGEPMLRIGELAASAGVRTSAVRFYESKGLLQSDARTAGQRRYQVAAIERLRLIVMLRQAGLSCSDIAVALDRSRTGAETRRRLAGGRAAELRGQIMTTLSALIVIEHASHCTRAADDDICIDEIRRQRDHALLQADEMLAAVGSTSAAER